MRKRMLSICTAVAVAVCLLFSACRHDTLNTHRMRTFISMVEKIEAPVTLLSDAQIQACFIVYSYLDDAERADAAVSESKKKLDGYKESFDILKKEEDERLAKEREERNINAFLRAAGDIPDLSEVTQSAASLVGEALVAYEALSAGSRMREDVAKAYEKVTQAQTRIETLAKEEHLAAVKRAAEAFIDAVDGLGEITTQSRTVLFDLLYDYNAFDEETRAYAGVAEAKEKLDGAIALYSRLQDEEDIESFAAMVEALGEITLESRSAIVKAETLYSVMSETAKAQVGAEYERLQAARARYDELFRVAEEERVKLFLAAAEAIPEDLGTLDMSWFDVLEAAKDAYFALAYETMQRPDVEAAYSRYAEARRLFDEKGYRQIPAVAFHIAFSGDQPPYIVLQNFNEASVAAAIWDFYGVSSHAELSEYAIAYLDVYVEGEYAGKVEFDLKGLANGFILQNVVPLLQALAQENSAVTSGANFSFCVHFEDRQNSYIPSAKSYLSQAVNRYTW